MEYLDHAFENDMPIQISRYQHLLFMLIKEYDALHHVPAAKDMSPSDSDAHKALTKFRSHLHEGGILILDLYNPQSSGQKGSFCRWRNKDHEMTA